MIEIVLSIIGGGIAGFLLARWIYSSMGQEDIKVVENKAGSTIATIKEDIVNFETTVKEDETVVKNFITQSGDEIKMIVPKVEEVINTIDSKIKLTK